jgi:hypothetical protein
VEPSELAKLLEKLKKKAPEVYRHLIGVIKAILAIY